MIILLFLYPFIVYPIQHYIYVFITYIIDLFYSQNSSRIYDLDKKILSTNYDPICYHSIPIPDNEETNIYDCFDLFTTMELIDDKDNLYFNEETKEYIKYYKEINIGGNINENIEASFENGLLKITILKNDLNIDSNIEIN